MTNTPLSNAFVSANAAEVAVGSGLALNVKTTKVFYDYIKDNKNPRLRKLLPKNLIFQEEVEEIVSEDDNDTL